MVYLKSVENVITLGKLISLLFLFCLPLLSILFLKERPRSPCNVNHFSSWASEASPTLGCSIEISRDIYIYICACVCRMSNHVESRESNTRMLKVTIGRLNRTSDTRIIRFDYTLEQL